MESAHPRSHWLRNALLFLGWSAFMFALGHAFGDDLLKKLFELLGREEVASVETKPGPAVQAEPLTLASASGIRFENKLASFPNPAASMDFSIEASLGKRVCESHWCSTPVVNAARDAFVAWEALCSTQMDLLHSVNGCPVSVIFKPNDEEKTYRADLFLHAGALPVAEWVGLAPKERAGGRFVIGGL